MVTDSRHGAGFFHRLLRLPTFDDETEARTARFVAVIAIAGVAAPLVAAALALAGPSRSGRPTPDVC